MRTFLSLMVSALVGSALAVPSVQAQSTNPFVGAWELTERIEADGTVVEDQVEMIVFTDRHYSWITVGANRPSYPPPGNEATTAAARRREKAQRARP